MEKTMTDQQKIISYLTFKLKDEHFAFNVGKLINILEMVKITKVPKTPEYMRGIINLRGEVLPVIDTKIKLGMGESEITGSTCILVIETQLDKEKVRLGAMVDSVLEVLEIEDADIKTPPSIGNENNMDFITGVVEHNDKFIMLMDIDQILNKTEKLEMKKVKSQIKE